jgi:hypothetical protein
MQTYSDPPNSRRPKTITKGFINVLSAVGVKEEVTETKKIYEEKKRKRRIQR